MVKKIEKLNSNKILSIKIEPFCYKFNYMFDRENITLIGA